MTKLVKEKKEQVFWVWYEHIVQPTTKVLTLPITHPFHGISEDNCLFVCGHSYNVGRHVRMTKNWEGKSYRTRASFMVYCSVQKDDKKLGDSRGWTSDTSIQPSHAYTLSRIGQMRAPGVEGYDCDWVLEDITILTTPIFLPKGVGMSQTGRYPNVNNTHLHGPWLELQRQILLYPVRA